MTYLSFLHVIINMTRQFLFKTTIVALALLICAGAKSQSIVGLGKEEGSASLYRGNLPKTYPFRFNGTYYWSQKSFQYGSVFYNGKLYENVILNVDAYQGQLLVSPERDHVPIVVFRDQVAWFTMGDSKFLSLNY